MGLKLYPIKSLTLSNGSRNVSNFHSDTIASVGDIINILGIDYQIKNIDGDKLILNKPYEYIGELQPDKMKLKVLPNYIKSQVKLAGELLLITVEDLQLDLFKFRGMTCPGWWYVYSSVDSDIGRCKVELIMPIVTHDFVEDNNVIEPELSVSKPTKVKQQPVKELPIN